MNAKLKLAMPACLLTLALPLAACGSSGAPQSTSMPHGTSAAHASVHPNDAAQVRSTLTRFDNAIVQGNGAVACSLMTQAGRQYVASQAQMHGGSCEGMVSKLHGALSEQVRRELENAQVMKVTVKGNTAVARVSAAGSSTNAQLERVGGTWLMSYGI